MKQIAIIIALALFATLANAQNITGSHQVRVDDEVKKQLVEYDDVDTKGQDAALVCSVSGIVYRQQSQTGQAGDYSLMPICCDGLHRGQYVLYLNVNGQVTSQTVNL